VTDQRTIEPHEAGQRLDIYLAGHMPTHSRAALQRAIKSGQITVNSATVKSGYLLRAGDMVSITSLLAEAQTAVAAVTTAVPSIPILHEDATVVVINKPAGLLTHAAEDLAAPSVAAWFAERYPTAREVGDAGRPGIVHRLDRDTSGAMILAKTPESFMALKEQFKRHYVQKEYVALVYGVPGGQEGRITRPIVRSQRNPNRRTVVPAGLSHNQEAAFKGKPAITEWRREEIFVKKYALLRVMPYTGRTHQIRVHLHFIGHPIIGDPLYTFKRQPQPPGISRLMLHAEKLSLRLPAAPQGKPKKTFTAPLPAEFAAALEHLRQA
jgi:23S rRNA pseudouridine1911/1915/1917 synthase